VVELLVRKGADVNATSSDGATPLHMAALKGHTDVAQVLIANGVEARS